MPVPAVATAARYLIRYALLTIGVMLTTFGLVSWTDRDFDLSGFWLVDNGWQLHPVHVLIVGIGLIPQAMWEILVLETARHAAADADNAIGIAPHATANDQSVDPSGSAKASP